MKEVKDMTKEEFLKYCVDKKLKGVTFREFANIFEKNGIDSETRKFVMNKLDEIDKQQNEVLNKLEKTNKIKSGFLNLIVGIGILIFGFILYANTAKAGVVFIFNFVVWGFGATLIIRGLLNIIGGFINND